MEITRNNYEAFILDYVEGTLGVEDSAELLVFLEANPDLKAEFEAFENIELPLPKEVRFDQKDLLKKQDDQATITETNYEHYLIAALEGDLTSEEEEQLAAFLVANPAYNKDQVLFEKTVLAPDNTIVFQNKLALKRVPVVGAKYRRLYYYASSVAAALILATVFFNYNNTVVDNGLAEEVPVKIEESVTIPAPAEIEKKKDLEEPQMVNQVLEQESIEPSQPETSIEYASVQEEIIPVKLTDTMPKAKEDVPQKLMALEESIVEDSVTMASGLVPIEPVVETIQSEVVAVSIDENNDEEITSTAIVASNKTLTFGEFLAHSLKKKVLGKERVENEKSKGKISFFNIAEATVKGVNKVFGTEMGLNGDYDDEGEMTAFAFSSKNISVSRNNGYTR